MFIKKQKLLERNIFVVKNKKFQYKIEKDY